MINNYTEQEITEFAKFPKLIKFSKWFEAKNLFSPCTFYVAYDRGYSYLFNKDGKYFCYKGHHDNCKQCIESWAHEYEQLANSDLNSGYDLSRIVWELTPCEKPSADYIEKCKIALVKDMIRNYEEHGRLFTPADYVKFNY